MFNAGFFQYHPKFGAVQENLKTILSALDNIEADLVVLPELAITGYYFKNRTELKSVAEDPAGSPTVESLKAFCKERKLYLVTGFAEKASEKVFMPLNNFQLFTGA